MSTSTINSMTYLLDGESLPYRLVRSGRRHKTISLEYEAGRGISIAVPSDMSDYDVNQFLHTRKDWLRECKQAMANTPPPPNWDKGAVIPFRGKDVQVAVQYLPNLLRHGGVLVQRSIDGGELQISLQEGMSEARRDRIVPDAIERWYISEAEQYLPARLAEWAEVTGLRPDRVRVGNARTRWGSCSGRRTVSLAWRLIRLPDRLTDYVIVHELAHLREMNHQRLFWELVESIMPDAKARRKELREISQISEG